jgi:hypothetical protein
MKTINMREKQLGHYSHSERMTKAQKVCILCEEIHYHQNAIIPFRQRQALDKIQGYHLLGTFRHWQRLKKTG